MRTRSRVLAVGIGMTFAAGGIPQAVAGPSPSPTPHIATVSPGIHGRAKSTPTRTLTLITGDVVSAAVQPDGRIAASLTSSSGGGYVTKTVGKDSYLIPRQAEPYVTTGVLDKELFNLSRLLRDGYDDRRQTTLPLIVSYGTARDLAERAVPDGSRTVRDLRSISAAAVRENKKQAGDFWRDLTGLRPGALPRAAARTGTRAPALSDGITKVWLDRKVKASLDVSVPQIGAPEAWKAGYTGKGVTVAVLDTGIAKHPDLDGKVTEAKDFSGSETGTDDRIGHGTHVASTIVGSGAASNGRYKGVAPDAHLINGKVLGDDGSGAISQVIAGMEWAASTAQVVSMSLGTDEASDGSDPSSQAVDNLTKSTGALFVIAAGNAGPAQTTIGAPGTADAALTVGAVSKQDELADFSSRGPRLGDNAIKPEITAPGVGIVAARVKGTLVGDKDPVDDNYARASGTSMATPHVAGAAALLAQQHTDWKADRLKAALTSTAKTLPGLTPFEQGAGRVDVARASSQTVTASAGTLDLGYFESPFAGTDPVVKKVTYANASDKPVTLDLALAATSDQGTPAGRDLLKVEPASLTVPANGTADASVTLDLTHGDLGLYSGALTATEHGGTASLRTAVAFTKAQVHRVALKALDREGRPASALVTVTSQSSGEDFTVEVDATGPSTVKVHDDGPFFVTAFVSTKDAGDRWEVEETAFALPDRKITDDTELVFDARKAKPVTVRVPRSAEPYELSQGVYRKAGQVDLLVTVGADVTTSRLSAVPSETAVGGEFEYTTDEHLLAPQLPRVRTTGSRLALHPTYMGLRGFVNPRLDGRQRLEVVDVGAGRPEDYAGKDVSGKIALIAYNPDGSSSDLIATAAERGAKAALIHGDKPGMFRDQSVWKAPIPPLQIDHGEGRALLDLLKKGPVRLDIEAVGYSPFDYSIVLPEKNRIPASLTYRLGADRFATISTRFYSAFANQLGAYSTFGRRPYQYLWVSNSVDVPFPHRQERYALADPDTEYGEFGYVQYPFGRYPTAIFGHTYKPGEHTTEEWFKGPLGPAVTNVHVPVSRQGNTLLLNWGEITDSDPNHAMGFDAPEATVRVYKNGELFATGDRPNGTLDLGTAERATYRVELDVKQQVPEWTLAKTSHSEWTFDSAATPADDWTPLPIVNNYWDLALDGNNAARAGAPFTLKLKPATQFGAPQVPVKDVEVAVSYDSGATWQDAADPVRGTDGTYRTTVRHPKKTATDGFVALRLRVTDTQGNKLDQTINQAYALK